MLSHVVAPASHLMAQDFVLDLAPQTNHFGNRGTVFFYLGGGEGGRGMMWRKVRRTVLR